MARTYRIGRYSGTKALISLDGRTREAKFARAITAELVEHVGGQPNAAQTLLIRLMVVKILRIALMSDYVLSQESISERDDREFLCWSNSLRRDLDVLGITKRATQSPSLKEYTSARYGGRPGAVPRNPDGPAS